MLSVVERNVVQLSARRIRMAIDVARMLRLAGRAG